MNRDYVSEGEVEILKSNVGVRQHTACGCVSSMARLDVRTAALEIGAGDV